MPGQSSMDSDLEQQLATPYPGGMPVLRIGLTESRDSVDFRLSGRFSVLNDQGMSILKDVASQVKWRLKIEQRLPAKYRFGILVGKFHDRQLAQDLEYKLIEKGIGTRIKIRGGKLFFNEQVVNDNTQFWVVIDDMSSEQEAIHFARERLAGFSYQIIKEKVNEPHALLELFDSEFEKLGEAENVIRIIPESSEVMTYIYDSPSSEGDPRKRGTKYRVFNGPLEFRCSNDGKIIIICEMALEKYVESVVALQMNEEFPVEAVKAQAIAVRSKTLAYLGIKHHEDVFHVCADSHCQLFRGLIPAPKNVLKAVQETMGMVLQKKQHVIDANYSLTCGGYTEAYHNLNYNEGKDPYPPVFDGPDENRYGDLTRENNLNKWVNEQPNVYCSFSMITPGNKLNHIRSRFRWQIVYDRQELEEIISSKLGADIGTLYDIVPIRRGVSGRLLELEILASKKNTVLVGEQKICDTLATDKLSSSCFVIDRQFDDNGFPLSFTLRGAGSGHGVGLCQAGGAAMAFQGKSHEEIVTHYFKGSELHKIY